MTAAVPPARTTPVVLVPSLGRAAADFDGLARRLSAAGRPTVAVDPPGVGSPAAPADTTDLHDLAAHVVAAIDAAGVGPGPVHLVGHALGNRIARCLTADRPDRVRSLTLLAAGGLVEPEPEVWRALAGCFVLDAPEADRLADIALAFFADPTGAVRWLDGWYPEIATVQAAAVRRTDRDDWWGARAPHVLVVQGLQDRVAVPDNGRRYVADLRAQAVDARLVEIDGAGHALLPEQPDAVADALLAFLASLPD